MMTEGFTTRSNYRIEVDQLLGMEPMIRVRDEVRGTCLNVYLTQEECLELSEKLTRAAGSADLRGIGENKTSEE